MLRHRRPPRALSLALALLWGCAPAYAAGAAPTLPQGTGVEPPAAPRLVVLLVVDQLRADLLDRYATVFDGGLKRLLDGGRRYTRVTMDHLVTETAPGHATLSTGLHPSGHGVVANLWWEEAGGTWRSVENVVDTTTRIAGEDRLYGASPRVLREDGVADWLLAARPGARVVSVSGKARGAVLLAGRGTDPADRDVYWFEPALGGFATSTAYRDTPAEWVREFNASVMPGHRADTTWTSHVPPELAALSRPDTAGYEFDGVRTHFPHSFGRAREATGAETDFWSWWASTPGPDEAALQLAGAAIEARGLGLDETPDLLAVSLSQTDRVGHAHGPLSREQMDNLLRLDAALGRFFATLDARVGEGAWSVVLTADHGAMDMPEWSSGSDGVSGTRLGSAHLEELQALLGRVSREVGSADPARLGGPLAEAVAELPWIARAWSHDDLSRGMPADSFTTLAVNGYAPGRPSGLLGRFGVEYQVAEGVLPFGFETGGSTHQSGYLHDRWIPLVVLGPDVPAGTVSDPVSAVAVAPTLAALLGVPVPGDLPAQSVISRGSSRVP